MQESTDRREAIVFRSHAAAQGVCDNLINALKLMANQQKDGDSPVKMVVQGFQEKSRLKIMEGLRRFILVDNPEVVKVGDLEKNVESRPVVKPKSTTYFLDVVVRSIPLVNEDWHAICQAIFQGVEGSDCYNSEELHKSGQV